MFKLKKMKAFFSQYWILILFVSVKFILQFTLVNSVYELHRDEFLHLDQANHLAFGFISTPPFTSLVSRLIFLLGGGVFWVHFFPAFFGAMTIVFVWLIVESIGGNLLSKILASSAILFSVLVRINMLFQPNSFDILAWTMIFYLLIKQVQTNNTKWLYYLAIVVAMGFYNKYNLVFLLGGLFVGLLLTSQRKLFVNVSFWKAIFVLVLLLLPNLIWQVVYHFPVIEHMKALKATQLDNNSSISFLKDQVLFFSGSMVLIVSAIIAFLFYKPFKSYRFIGICFMVVIILFTLLKAKNYYAFGLYPVTFAFGSVCLERILSRKWRLTLVPLLISLNLAGFVFTAKLIYPLSTPLEIKQNSAALEKLGLLRWEDGQNHALPQDFADMVGWREMAEKSLSAYLLIPENERAKTLVFCDNYGQSGALNYYNRKKMPLAYSFNTDYIYWLPRLDAIKNVVLVGNKPEKELIAMFRSVKLVGVIENEYAREKGTRVYLMSGAKSGFTQTFYTLADNRIKTFEIF